MKTKVVEDVLEDGTITKRFEQIDRQRSAHSLAEDINVPAFKAAEAKRERRKLRNIRNEWAKVAGNSPRGMVRV